MVLCHFSIFRALWNTCNTKVIFFWDQSQDMNSSDFPAKKQCSNSLFYLVFQLESFSFCGKLLELMFWLRSQKKRTLVHNIACSLVYSELMCSIQSCIWQEVMNFVAYKMQKVRIYIFKNLAYTFIILWKLQFITFELLNQKKS